MPFFNMGDHCVGISPRRRRDMRLLYRAYDDKPFLRNYPDFNTVA
jgi:hypothetical protein